MDENMAAPASTKEPRNLIDVIDKLVSVAPDLEQPFAALRTSIQYSAPEMMQTRWQEASFVMGEHASGHPKEHELAAIWMDKTPEEFQEYLDEQGKGTDNGLRSVV